MWERSCLRDTEAKAGEGPSAGQGRHSAYGCPRHGKVLTLEMWRERKQGGPRLQSLCLSVGYSLMSNSDFLSSVLQVIGDLGQTLTSWCCVSCLDSVWHP